MIYDTFLKTVIVNAKPVADFNIADICNGNEAAFTNNSNITGDSIISYSWNFGDGNISSDISPTHAYATSGKYPVTLTTATTNCSDTITKNITVFNRPSAAFTATEVCEGNSTQFSDASVIANGSIRSYLWMLGNGDTSSAMSPSYKYARPGNYNVKLVATSNSGFIDSFVNIVTVYPKPVPKFTVNNTCVTNAASFTNTSTVSSGNIVSYIWRFGDGTTSTVTNPTKSYNTAGTYDVTLSVTTNNSCVDSTVVKGAVTVYPKLTFGFTFTNRCLDSAINFSNTSTVATGTITGYAWDFGDGIDTSTSKDPSYTYNNSGAFTVNLIVTTNNGCRDSLSKVVHVNPLPNLTITQITSERNVKFTVSDSSFASYAWSFGDGKNSASKSPSHRYPAIGDYKVTLLVTSKEGCSQTFIDTVNIIANNISNPQVDNVRLIVYPNPFAKNTTIEYYLLKPATVELSVYDLYGRIVTLVPSKQHTTGKYSFDLDGQKYNLKGGAYILNLELDGISTYKHIVKIE